MYAILRKIFNDITNCTSFEGNSRFSQTNDLCQVFRCSVIIDCFIKIIQTNRVDFIQCWATDDLVMSNTNISKHPLISSFLAHQIKISACFTCTYKSYLANFISGKTGIKSYAFNALVV